MAAALSRHLGADLVGVLALMPPGLRTLIGRQQFEPTADVGARHENNLGEEDGQIAGLEERLNVLMLAIRELIGALQTPPQATGQLDIAEATRRAHGILLAAPAGNAGG